MEAFLDGAGAPGARAGFRFTLDGNEIAVYLQPTLEAADGSITLALRLGGEHALDDVLRTIHVTAALINDDPEEDA